MEVSNQQHIIFDWDGTLADSIPLWIDIYQDVLGIWGVNATTSDIFNKAYGKAEGVNYFGIVDSDSFNDDLFKNIKHSYSSAPLFSHVKSVIKDLLSKNCRISISTNTPRNLILSAIQENDLSDYFSGVCAREDVVKLKPDIHSLDPLLNACQIDRRNTWMVGDSMSDIEVARLLGIKSIFFNPSGSQYHKDPVVIRSKTYREIYSLDKIQDIVGTNI